MPIFLIHRCLRIRREYSASRDILRHTFRRSTVCEVSANFRQFSLILIWRRTSSDPTKMIEPICAINFEWLACWTQAQMARVQIAVATLSGSSLRQTVHTHRASVHQAPKLVAALLRVAGVTVGLAESNGGLPPGLWLTSPAGWLPRIGISSGTLCSVIEYGLPLHFWCNKPSTLVFVFYTIAHSLLVYWIKN